ncbi:MAG: hypothetical protein AAGA03_20085 [Planctomycetota bacterium]
MADQSPEPSDELKDVSVPTRAIDPEGTKIDPALVDDILEPETGDQVVSASEERRQMRRRKRMALWGAALAIGLPLMVYGSIAVRPHRQSEIASIAPAARFELRLREMATAITDDLAARESEYQLALAEAKSAGQPVDTIKPREPTLQKLHINEYEVTDQMLQRLRSLDPQTRSGIDTVIIDFGKITDEGAKAIATLPRLQHIRIRLSPLTDQALQAFADGCPDLWYLNLPHAACTASGVAQLSKISKLRQLRLGSKRLSNEVTRAIAEIKSLRGVHLIGVPVNDEGMKTLATMPILESLYLDDSSVTNEGWNWLFRHHPELHVHINEAHHDRDPKHHEHHD